MTDTKEKIKLDLKLTPEQEERYQMLRQIGEECTTEEELKALLSSPKVPIMYDGFEPSGRMHIAQGLIRSINVNRALKAGCHFKFWVADWFAQMNLNMGGDLKKIRKSGELMIAIWKACGMETDKVEFIWASEAINAQPGKYWQLVIDIATKNSVHQIKRCTTIMGKESGDDLAASQIFYPCMQAADIFFLGVDICSLGVDQRKVNMLAREYAAKSKRKFRPIILSHHMLRGLDGSDKMSKSNPDNAIFMDDSPGEVKRKIKKAYCKPGEVENNPILEYVEHIIFPLDNKFTILRDEKYGGNKTYESYSQVEKDFVAEELHPGDLKQEVIKCINRYLEPVQILLTKDPKIKQLAKTVAGYRKIKPKA